MAHPSRLSLWAFLHRETLQLQVTEFAWPKQLDLKLSDIEVRLTLDNRPFTGRGTAATSELAFDIALAEALERGVQYSARQSGQTYAGFAAHITEELASQSSIQELIERDSFFCHFYTQTPFLEEIDPSILGEAWEQISKYLKKHQTALRSFRMRTPNGFTGVFTAANGPHASRPFQLILGLGCSSEENLPLLKALQSSIWECLRNLTAWLENISERALTLSEFLSLPHPGPKEHQSLAMSLDHRTGIDSLFPTTAMPTLASEVQGTNSGLASDLIQTKRIPFPTKNIPAPPLVFMGATHPEAIQTQFGKSHFSDQKLGRLKRFNPNMKAIFTEPHPIG
ncbi:hypothetical protein WDW37_13215 [Bdellovibrionota bacterium FG-1]